MRIRSVVWLGALTLCLAAVSRGWAAEAEMKSDYGRAVLNVIRTRAAGSSVETAAPELARPDGRPLLVTFYSYHRSADNVGYVAAWHGVAMGDTLRASAEQAGAALGAFLAPLKDGADVLESGRIQFDLVLKESPLKAKNRVFAAQKLELGVDGCRCVVGEKAYYFTPTAILRHARSIDILQDVFKTQENMDAPDKMALYAIRTASFVEARPGNAALPVVRGNTLVAAPTPFDMADACFKGGQWLLRTQQENGAFLPAYFPAAARSDPRHVYDLTEHMRAALTLALLNRLTGDKRFLDAQEKALQFAAESLTVNHRLGAAFLQTAYRDPKAARKPLSEQAETLYRDEVLATALLLTTFCTDALRAETPTADRRMRYVGAYLCQLVDEDGRLHASLANAQAKKENRIMQGEPYAEALVALCMLERISPNSDVRAALLRLLKLMSSFRSSAPPYGPRTIEAFAEAYALLKDPKLAAIAFELGALLVKAQVGPDQARYPDSLGAFREPDTDPQTFTTAQAVRAVAAAYQAGLVARRSADDFKEPVRMGANFLINMQFRRDNSFCFSHHEVIMGGFRKGANDLTLNLGATAESISALMSASGALAAMTQPQTAPGKTGP